jgi:hypothetical protein
MRQPISVNLEMRPCWALAALIAGLHLAAALAALAIDWPLWLRAVVVGLVASGAGLALRRHALLTAPGACIRARLRDDGQCWWLLRSGTEVRGHLLPRWFSTPWLTVLRLDSGGPRATELLLTPCKIDSQVHRQLRVLLESRL